MKNNLLKALPYIIAGIFAIAFVIIDIINFNKVNEENKDIDNWARTLVNSSEIMVFDKIYHGSYDTEEIIALPDDYVVIGTITECVEDGVELTKNFTSHVLQPGYDIYCSPEDESVVFVKITQDDEEFQSYLPYFLDVTDETLNALENIVIE